jgi:hypothetical protein
MLDAGPRRILWRVFDGLDYVLTLVGLRILDALTGPLPQTPEDQQREREREQLKRAFSGIDCKGPATISHCTDCNRGDG